MTFLGTAAGAVLLSVDVWLLSFIGISISAIAIPLVFLLPRPIEVERQVPGTSSAEPQRVYRVPAQGPEGIRLLPSLTLEREALTKRWTVTHFYQTMVMEAYLSFYLLVDLLRDPLTRVTMLIYLCDEIAIYVRVTFPQ
jgi:hypothetical protein